MLFVNLFTISQGVLCLLLAFTCASWGEFFFETFSEVNPLERESVSEIVGKNFKKLVSKYFSIVQKERADTNERTNERTTNEIPFSRRVEFDPVVPKLTRFDPVVPELKLNLILSFQIQKVWSCRSKFKKVDPVVPKLKLNLILSFQIQKSWSCRSQIEIKSDTVVLNSKSLILSF